MITSFQIKNFKSLRDFAINDLGKNVFLIGLNGSGKSTVLQAIDFVCSLGLPGNPQAWLAQREWEAKDINCKVIDSNVKNINFELRLNVENQYYAWSGSFNNIKGVCTSEAIKNTTTGEELFAINENRWRIRGNNWQEIVIQYPGSALAHFAPFAKDQELSSFRNAIQRIVSIDLIAPGMLKRRTKSAAPISIGLGGEKIAAFLYSLSKDEKNAINKLLKGFYPTFSSVDAKSKRFGVKYLVFTEAFEKSTLISEAHHINDGLLRILAILAQTQTKTQTVLIDEIEDGINHELMQNLINYLRDVTATQTIVTTHSPLILNYLSDDEAKKAIYLVYKNMYGETKVRPFFELPGTLEKLEFLGPGEVMANVNLVELSSQAENGMPSCDSDKE